MMAHLTLDMTMATWSSKPRSTILYVERALRGPLLAFVVIERTRQSRCTR